MNRFQRLREQAEQLLADAARPDATLQSRDLKALLHELEVRRIELEVQNEELRESQMALARSRSKFYNLFEFAPIGYAVLDHNGIIEQINETGAAVFRFPKQQLIGMRLGAMVLPPGTPFFASFKQVVSTGLTCSAETQFIRKKGRFWAHLELSRLQTDSDDPCRVLCALTNITRQKATEEELNRYRNHLEGLVKERTAELETSNLRLQREVARRIASETELVESLKEKEVLLREIHHRVKNNMQVIISLLRLQARKIPNDHVAQIFRESETRIMAMAIIHETLYQQRSLLSIDLNDYLTRLTDNLVRAYTLSGLHIHVDIDTDDVVLDIDQAVPCGLIISELVSNSLKYAFEGKGVGTIAIRFRAMAGDTVEMTVRDDGIGLPESIDPHHTRTMGLATVSSLAQRQLGAEMAVSRKGGTCWTIRFQRGLYTKKRMEFRSR